VGRVAAIAASGQCDVFWGGDEVKSKHDRRRKPLKPKNKKRAYYPGNYTPDSENDWIGWGVRRRNVGRLEQIRNQE
jgi:hypothetical protein